MKYYVIRFTRPSGSFAEVLVGAYTDTAAEDLVRSEYALSLMDEVVILKKFHELITIQ